MRAIIGACGVRPESIPGWRPYTSGRWSVYYGDNCWIPDEPFAMSPTIMARGFTSNHSTPGIGYSGDPCRCPRSGHFHQLSLVSRPSRAGSTADLPSAGCPLAPDDSTTATGPGATATVVVQRGTVISINLSRLSLPRQGRHHSVAPYAGNRCRPMCNRIRQAAIMNNYRPLNGDRIRSSTISIPIEADLP